MHWQPRRMSGDSLSRKRMPHSLVFLLTLLLWVGRDVQAQTGTADLPHLQTDDRQWVMPAKNYAGTRYSGLNQISMENMARLQLVWTFPSGGLRGYKAAPLLIHHTMYIVTPYPNILSALDLAQPDGVLKAWGWLCYDPELHLIYYGAS